MSRKPTRRSVRNVVTVGGVIRRPDLQPCRHRAALLSPAIGIVPRRRPSTGASGLLVLLGLSSGLRAHNARSRGQRFDLHGRITDGDLLWLGTGVTRATAPFSLKTGDLDALRLCVGIALSRNLSRALWTARLLLVRTAPTALLLLLLLLRRLPSTSTRLLLPLLLLLALLVLLLRPATANAAVAIVFVARKFEITDHPVLGPLFRRVLRTIEQCRVRKRAFGSRTTRVVFCGGTCRPNRLARTLRRERKPHAAEGKKKKERTSSDQPGCHGERCDRRKSYCRAETSQATVTTGGGAPFRTCSTIMTSR